MNVLDVPYKIGFIPQLMFPKSSLPEGLFTFVLPCGGRLLPQMDGAMAGKLAFDQLPAFRKISIVRREWLDDIAYLTPTSFS